MLIYNCLAYRGRSLKVHVVQVIILKCYGKNLLIFCLCPTEQLKTNCADLLIILQYNACRKSYSFYCPLLLSFFTCRLRKKLTLIFYQLFYCFSSILRHCGSRMWIIRCIECIFDVGRQRTKSRHNQGLDTGLNRPPSRPRSPVEEVGRLLENKTWSRRSQTGPVDRPEDRKRLDS